MPYYPIVAAHYWDGDEYRPAEFLGSPTAPPGAPSAPSGLDFTSTTDSITVTWVPSVPGTGDGISHYVIRRGGVVVGMSGTTTYLDTGLLSSTVYTYTVQAVPDSGEDNASALSSPLVAQTLGLPVSTATKFGWHTLGGDGGLSPWSNAYAGSVVALGKPRCSREFSSGATLPLNFNSFSAPGPNDKSILHVVSWKPVYATLLAGGYDTIINNFLTWVHNNQYHVRLGTWHEYDVKSMNAAQFKAMWSYVAEKVRAFGSPYVQNALINGGMAGNAASQATYLPSDLSLIDVFASDPYSLGQARSDRWTYAGGVKAINNYHYNFKRDYLPATVKSGLGEIGWAQNIGGHGTGDTPGPGIDSEGAAWYRGAFDRCIEIGMEFVCVYNHDAANQYAMSGNRLALWPQCAAVVKQYVEASPLYLVGV